MYLGYCFLHLLDIMPDNKLKLKLVTPARTVLEDEVDQVTLNTENGQITVMPHHALLVAILRPGEMITKKNGQEIPLAASGGIIIMSPDNTLIIMADSAEHAKDIDLARAEAKARQLVEELKSKTQLDITTYKTLQRRIERENTRINLVKKWRK